MANRAAGDVIRVAVNMDTHKVWFGTNAGFNGNPAAGTGGFTLPPNFGRLVPHINPRSASGAKFTLRSLSADFAHAPPSGFTPYAEVEAHYAGAGVPDASDDFVETIGVCCKFNRGGVDDYKQPLIDSGIRYLRTMLTDAATPLAHAKELYDDHGIRFNVRLVQNGGAAGSSFYNLPETTDFYNAAINPTKLGIPAIITSRGRTSPIGRKPRMSTGRIAPTLRSFMSTI